MILAHQVVWSLRETLFHPRTFLNDAPAQHPEDVGVALAKRRVLRWNLMISHVQIFPVSKSEVRAAFYRTRDLVRRHLWLPCK